MSKEIMCPDKLQPVKKLCPVAGKCGGCQLQNMAYPDQLKYKQSLVIGLLGKFCRVDDIIGMDSPFFYRNKVQAAFGKGRNGIISGVYQSSSHKIVPIDSCLLEDKKADEIIVFIRELCRKHKVSIFNDETGKGFLRHVLVKRSFATNEIMVCLVTGTAQFPGKRDFIESLLSRFPEITTIIQNVNNKFTSLVLGKEEHVLYGPGKIEDVLLGKRFLISAPSFYQINPFQTEALYSLAINGMKLRKTDTLVDAYCGTGTIGIAASDKVMEVIGVELNPAAVKDAIANAKRNKAENCRFFKGDAGDFLLAAAEEGMKADAVIMDPPRAGRTATFVSSLCPMSPSRVAYVSCDPEALARDLKYLTTHGYKVNKITPLDMFPHSNHVETVCLLVLRNHVTHINIDVDVEELVQDKRGQATYPQIKEYVLEQTGLKVSSLYISQIKRKCGLDVGDSYNKPKSEDARVPQCPPEKEKAIMDALRHFGITN
ncbi:MAG: 23S rRNA (uracil(1939)-C(5))-methyltransferase RlmD [Oscillospiraceae bacterium]|nr:23S rRNA (uracil(1939)-C(5))-methyltransferase RlmD [Oscillospiraceae bacterium]